MPRACTVCTHSERPEIDRALVEGVPNRRIATQYGLGEAAVRRHRTEHLPEHLSKAQEAAETAQADDLLGQMVSLQTSALTILATAEGAGDGRLALMAVREARGNLELLAKLMGQLNERATVNILMAPEWLTVQAVLMAALAPYPESRAAVAGSLRQLEAGASSDRGVR